MNLSNFVRNFRAFYPRWNMTPSAKPHSYFARSGIGNEDDAQTTTKTLQALYALIAEKESLLVKIGNLANSQGRLDVNPDTQGAIEDLKECVKKHFNSKRTLISSVIKIDALNIQFSRSAFGATPAAAGAFYKAAEELLHFLSQDSLWD